MELNRYGVTLNRLTINKIELVRNWRNDPKISEYMFFNDYITQEMQVKWFNSINNDLNYYFIAVYKDEEIGLCNIKNIDKEKKCGEGGIFVYVDKYVGTEVPFRVNFCLLDFAFEVLKLDYVYGRMLPSNKHAIRFNKFLGANIESSVNGKTVLSTIIMENYGKQRDKYAKLFS